MSEDELNEFMDSLYSDGVQPETVVGLEGINDTDMSSGSDASNESNTIEIIGDTSMDDISAQIELNNSIGCGLILFLGVIAGLIFAKLLWGRLR